MGLELGQHCWRLRFHSQRIKLLNESCDSAAEICKLATDIVVLRKRTFHRRQGLRWLQNFDDNVHVYDFR